MRTTSGALVDYLVVACEHDRDDSRSHRTSSFTEQPGRLSERAASNLSLRSAAAHSQRRRASSRSNASHASVRNNHEEKVKFQSVLTTPVIESSEVIQNSRPSTPLMQGSQAARTADVYRLYTPSKKSRWTDLFVYSRSNDENSDVYKILSILYGLVIFVGGVAFSISHAIIPAIEAESIKHLAEIYFTYLYWVSIVWIIFCMLDIVHHRHKLPINTAATVSHVDTHYPQNNSVSPRPAGRQHMPSLSKEVAPRSPSTPYFNLQLFDDSDEFEIEDDDQMNDEQLHEARSSKPNRDDNDEEANEGLQWIRRRSQSMENLSTKSTASLRDRAGTIRNVLTRRRALDPGAAHHLRTYVRHRKDSIVQRVIGYNYDDHSTAGGLYIRVGIGIFCLGTVIHSGLSILSNLENLHCVRWTAVMDDSSRLLFSFIQFFFIFKHSNLIIRAHESLARLAVIHIVVTNLCVWFRMVVVETKAQIAEMNSHESLMTQLAGAAHAVHGRPNTTNQYRPVQMNSSSCIQSVEEAMQEAASINVGYMRLKPLLYPCTIEFSLMCLTLFYLIWENIGKTFAHKMSDKASSKNVFMVNCHASIKGLFGGMIVFSCTVLSIILYAVFRHKIGDDPHSHAAASVHALNSQHHSVHARAAFISTTWPIRHHASNASTLATTKAPPETPQKILYSIAIVEIVNFFLLSISLLGTTWALFKIRKLQYKRTATRFDDVLIIVSLTGTYLYTIFSAFALLNNQKHSTWIAYLKIVIVVLEFIEATVHAFFILVALRKRLHRTNKHQYPAREIITLLIMLDLSLWFEETTTTTKHEANPFQLAFYHVIPWSIIAAIATPLQIFFRFHASVCLSHVWENMYILPVYQAVAPHGL